MIKKFIFPIINLHFKLLAILNPKLLSRIRSRIFLNRKLDLKNPKDLNEKINWLQFNTDTSLWSELSDKHKVRDYVKKHKLDHILIKQYGVWKNAKDINFDNLPNSFVLKPNNGCGDVIKIYDKNQVQIKKLTKNLNKSLKAKFGLGSAELHYLKINPLIIAEELLNNNSAISSSIIDYKFWCIHGEPICCLVCYDRTRENLGLALYDINWNSLNEHLLEAGHFNKGKQISKPISFNEMLHACRLLSKEFPSVRIDFYEVDNKPYFGEMTFTAANGLINYFTVDFLLEMGNKIILDKKNNTSSNSD